MTCCARVAEVVDGDDDIGSEVPLVGGGPADHRLVRAAVGHAPAGHHAYVPAEVLPVRDRGERDRPAVGAEQPGRILQAGDRHRVRAAQHVAAQRRRHRPAQAGGAGLAADAVADLDAGPGRGDRRGAQRVLQDRVARSGQVDRPGGRDRGGEHGDQQHGSGCARPPTDRAQRHQHRVGHRCPPLVTRIIRPLNTTRAALSVRADGRFVRSARSATAADTSCL
jgi:hypothetical protein